VAFGDIALSYENEPFAAMLSLLAKRAVTLAGMEAIPALAGLSPWTRMEAARLLASGGQVMAFAQSTAPARITPQTKLEMPAVNRAFIRELAMQAARVPLAAVNAGTGVEISNTDALLLLARCEHGRTGAVKAATESMKDGNIVVKGRSLAHGEVEKLLSERLKILEGGLLDKFAEIGVVSIAS
jgi:hypothetical protein